MLPTSSIFAGYAPDTQRKDKFSLPVQMGKRELREVMKQPFFTFYTQKYSGAFTATGFILRSIFATLLPELRKVAAAPSAQQRKLFTDEEAVSALPLSQATNYLSLKKGNVNQGFTLSVYLARVDISPSSLSRLLSCLYALPEDSEQLSDFAYQMSEAFQANGLGYEGDEFMGSGTGAIGFDPSKLYAAKPVDATALAAIRRLEMRANGSGSFDITADLAVRENDAVAFTQMPYVGIRNIDLFPVFLAWVQSFYKTGPVTSISVSRISAGLSPEASNYAKTNDNNLVLDADGELLYIPRKVDNSRAYEDAYIKCAANPSDPASFSLSNMAANNVKLPANMPVLVDWTNNKYCYSNTMGNLVVLDLSQCRTATKTHVVNVFKRFKVTDETVAQWINYRSLAAEGSTSIVCPPDFASLVDKAYVNGRSALVGDTETAISLFEICQNQELFAPLIEYLSFLGDALANNSALFNQRYSISASLETIGLLHAVFCYVGTDGKRWADTLQADDNNRSASTSQGVDPNWSLPSIPLLNPIIKAMPHQARVLNMLKDKPKNAMLPVAAGGGKTPIAIIEVLYHYKEGVNAPYLIMCPSTLVSQYAQEVSFFTNGRLNTIPITTKVIKREGFARLQKIFEAAPRNTVVVCSYNALAYNQQTIAYGTQEVMQYPTVNFLRQFGFQLAICDESHQLKNVTTSKSKSVRSLLSDIPYIRLASGTMAYNIIGDLVGQSAILDPSIFGTESEFKKTYGSFTNTGKRGKPRYIGLKSGAEAEILSKLKQNVVMAGAERKEWAALLPTPKTSYHMVSLSEEEREAYEVLIAGASQNIQTSEIYQKAQKRLQELRDSGASEDEIAEVEDRLGTQLQPYLQKVERFLMNPYAETALTERGVVSSKVREVLKIIKSHIKMFASSVTGEGEEDPKRRSAVQNSNKCIVFTENTASAEAIFAAASRDPQLAGTGLLYRAAEKTEALNTFTNDAKVRWLVGVETSINTGLNLQNASRIIRAEYPWAPGAIEQGDARILRPNKKGPDTRREVYFDWVAVDGTIDTLKISRLMSKSVQIARFENSKDPRYQKVGMSDQLDPKTGKPKSEVPVVRITLANIRASKTFGNTRAPGLLMPYFRAMRDLNVLRVKTFEEYRKTHQDELTPQGTLKDIPFTHEPNPKDAKLLKYVPYVEGTNLYKADELGLIRLDRYLAQFAENEEDYNRQFQNDEDSDDKDVSEFELPQEDSPLVQAIKDLKYKSVWTEYGECALLRCSVSSNRCTVRPVNTNNRIALTKDSVFVINTAEVKPRELYSRILKSVGFDEYSSPAEDVTPEGVSVMQRDVADQKTQRQNEINKQKQDEQAKADLNISLYPILINGVFGLRFKIEPGHDLALNVLQQNGFRTVPPYWKAKIRNYKALEEMMNTLNRQGYKWEAPYDYVHAWREIGRVLKANQMNTDESKGFKASARLVYRVITDYGIQDWLRKEMRPTKDPKVCRIQPMFSNGYVLAIMPADMSIYPAARRIRQSMSRTIKQYVNWVAGEPAYEALFATEDDALECVNKMIAEGLDISNLADIKSAASRAKRKRFMSVDQIKKAYQQKLDKVGRVRQRKERPPVNKREED